MARARPAGRGTAELSRDEETGEQPAAISERLAQLLGEPLTDQARQLSSGASRATYAFATASHGELVAQIERRAAQEREAQAQAALLAAAAQAGVPVPQVVASGIEDPVLGASWIVMEAIRGTTNPRQILVGEGAPQAGELLDSVAAALAAVHRMPVDPSLAPLVDDPLARLRETCDSLAQPHPTFELAFRALDGDRPVQRRTLVHGDFRLGNLMVTAGRVSAVLDWELTHLGDPLEDLGWLCVPAWRFTRPDRPAAGLGTREQLAAAYERHSGVELDLAAMRRWELAGTLRWGVICVMQAFTHLSGARRSLEHAVIGRRACEVEWDLLEMLDPQPASAQTPPALATASPPAPAAALHDRPTAVELLEAARGGLGEHVLPTLEGRAAFELRVALRALGMVARELSGAAEHAALRATALARVGVADEAELAAAIRGGAFDGRESEVYAALRDLVRAKLEVANPRYLEGQGTRTQKEGS
jgi:aminoglycoside phosphotransferase (APT) family kinase protein